MAADKAFAVFVTVEIAAEKVEEFVNVMKEDLEGSVKEPGCLHFDVLKNLEEENVFHFYEVYKSEADLVAHKETPHYAKWAEFKKAGGVVKQTACKAEGVFGKGVGM